jgi:catechol 2,3-dioxygenase-like lactoylglutathione lyase family enzyme
MQLDHVVLWVADPIASVAFFVEVVGLTAVRVDEFRAGATQFPSVRVGDDSIIDLVPKAAVPAIEAIPGARGTAGHITNHVCLAMTKTEFDALAERLAARGTPPGRPLTNSLGARGAAPRAFYFKDLDGNILEARHYD